MRPVSQCQTNLAFWQLRVSIQELKELQHGEAPVGAACGGPVAKKAKHGADGASSQQGQLHEFTVERLGGDDVSVYLLQTRTSAKQLKRSIAEAIGIPVYRQELFLVAQSADGSNVREYDQEPVV